MQNFTLTELKIGLLFCRWDMRSFGGQWKDRYAMFGNTYSKNEMKSVEFFDQYTNAFIAKSDYRVHKDKDGNCFITFMEMEWYVFIFDAHLPNYREIQMKHYPSGDFILFSGTPIHPR